MVVYTATFEDGTGDNQYYLRSGTTETRLYFDKDPGLVPGAAIHVVGEPMQDGLRVDSYELPREEGVGVNAEPLIMGMPYKARTFGMVLVDTGMGVNITKDEMTKRLFSTNPADKSVKMYYNEVSYGTQDISGEVLGPLMYAMTGCNTTGLAKALKPMVGMYDHYLWYIGQRTNACQFSGLAEGGQPERPTNDTWYNGSANCVVLVQEPGHNFGMMHSSSMTCSSMKPFDDDPDTTCTHNEYGDRYDPMGGACNHMNAWQKVFEGWLQQCNGVRVKSSGTYTLQPLELACDGPQVLQIPMPKVRPFGRSGGGGLATVENLGFYYLELRTARGFDSTIRSTPTVLVHVAEDFHSRKDRGRHTWLLDMDPTSTRTIEGLGVGKSFTDPAGGVTFTVMAMTMDSATIQVTVPGGTGAATCLDNMPYDPMVPRMCGGIVGPTGMATDAGVPAADGGAAVTPPPKVESYTLIDVATGKDIRIVQDMSTLDLSQLPASLALRIDTDPPVVGSVTMRIDGGAPRTENMAPYGITTHDARGAFVPWTLGLGAHTVTATAFDAANGVGRAGDAYEIDFTLVRSTPIGPDGTTTPGVGVGALPAAGGPAAPFAGRPAGLGAAGTGTATSPALASNPPLATSTRPPPPDTGCTCRVPGAGVGSTETPRAWPLAALAFGLFLRRRRSRRAN